MTVPAAARPTDNALRRALARAADAKNLDAVEAEVLLHARGQALAALQAAASRSRDVGLNSAGRPRTVTYSPKVFIPLTRLCRDRCHYCTFATAPSRLPAPYLSPDEVLATARAGAAAGCKEALFTLGDRPRNAGRRHANGSTRPATAAPSSTCGRWPSVCSRTPACSRT